MISSIFGKTKPINFIIVLSFLFAAYWLVLFFLHNSTYDIYELVLQVLFFTVLAFSVFVVDFIVKRNKITAPNSFAILFYALLILVFPETLADSSAIFCSLFLLMATRRLISIRSLKNIKLKVFDATLWVMVSSLFYEWAIIYLVLVFLAIYIYEPKNIRNWIVPFVGVFTVFMIAYCVLILSNKTDFLVDHYQFSFEFNVAYFSKWANSTKLVIYVILTFLAMIFAFLKLGKAGLGQIVTMRLIGFSFVLGLILKVLTSSADAHPIMVTFFPAAVFITNYVESIKKPNIKEVVLMVSVFIPLVILLTTLVIK
ncbi:hypothetical protein [Maribacter sp. 2308TA10-17]|uniref:hypothetical protein n=1 Tax=Maribacter sp. 2308TA10-17 TaxID=3386276 RepID=UPI0039BCE87C